MTDDIRKNEAGGLFGPFSEEAASEFGNVEELTRERDPKTEGGGKTGEERRRSTIKFPYRDLKTCLVIAEALMDERGHEDLTVDQKLKAAYGEKLGREALRQRINDAAKYKLIRREDSQIVLTDIGFRACRKGEDDLPVDAADRAQAYVQAFLSVPLYRKIYDKFRRPIFDNDVALGAFMVAQGVDPHASAKPIIVALQRSARLAQMMGPDGMSLAGPEQQVATDEPDATGEPASMMSYAELPAPGKRTPDLDAAGFAAARADASDGEGHEAPLRNHKPQGASLALHPIVQALVAAMPVGEWDEAARELWKKAMAATIDFVYAKSR